MVSGAQHARSPAHHLPAFNGGVGRLRLAVSTTVELQHGVAADDDGRPPMPTHPVRHCLGFPPRQLGHHVGHWVGGLEGFVDARNDDLGGETGRPQRTQPGR